MSPLTKFFSLELLHTPGIITPSYDLLSFYLLKTWFIFYYSDFINIISYLYAIYYLLYSGDSNISLYYKIFNKYLQNHIICEILILKNKRTLRRMFFYFLIRVLKDKRRTHHLRYSIKECVESLFYFNKTSSIFML